MHYLFKLNIQTHYLSTKFVTCHVVCSSCPYFKVGVARTVPNSHVTVFCFIPLVFQKSRVLRTVSGAACRSLHFGSQIVISVVKQRKQKANTKKNKEHC